MTDTTETDDAVIVAVIAEHLLNVMQAVAANGVDPDRAMRCASQALVQLDVLVADQQADRGRVASPHHTSALVAVDMLRRALTPMVVRTPDRIEGFPLLELYAEALDAVQGSVMAHWEMQANDAGRAPLKLVLPDGSERTVGGNGG